LHFFIACFLGNTIILELSAKIYPTTYSAIEFPQKSYFSQLILFPQKSHAPN